MIYVHRSESLPCRPRVAAGGNPTAPPSLPPLSLPFLAATRGRGQAKPSRRRRGFLRPLAHGGQAWAAFLRPGRGLIVGASMAAPGLGSAAA
jgi:hypothetical protein